MPNGHSQDCIVLSTVGLVGSTGVKGNLKRFIPDPDLGFVAVPMSDILYLTVQNPFGVDSWILLCNEGTDDADADIAHCTGAVNASHINSLKGFRIRISGDLTEFPVPAGQYDRVLWLDANDNNMDNKQALVYLEREYGYPVGAIGQRQIVTANYKIPNP